MQIRKEIRTIVLPIVKGLPITITLMVIATLATVRFISYTVSQYEVGGSIRLDNNTYKPVATQIFESENGAKDNSFLTEVEVFRSRSLLEATMKKLDFDITYYRKQKYVTNEMYLDKPFIVDYKILNKVEKDHTIYLQYLGDGNFDLFNDEEKKTKLGQVKFDKIYVGEDLVFTLRRLDNFILENPDALKKDDEFVLVFNTIQSLVTGISDANYFVRTIDKDIDIIKVYYRHEIPAKAALFVNTLFTTFIETVKGKQKAIANQTLDYIDGRLTEVEQKLKVSEQKLAGYKSENGIINTLQETDATLKELMQLDIKKVNFNVQRAELNRLYSYLAEGASLKDFSPNFETLNDPIFKDAFLKIQNYELQKKDLQLKYTEASEEIVTINTKINNLRTFIHESVSNTLKNIDTKKAEIESAIAEVNLTIQGFPDKERQIVVLEREVKLNEELYSQLVEKRTELAIAGNANGTLHAILDYAIIPKKPIWPNKSLIYGVSLMLAMVLGLALSFLNHFLFATIKNKSELEEMVSFPVIGTVSKVKKKDKNKSINAFANLYTNLEIINSRNIEDQLAKVITVSSFLSNEGKTFTAINLAKTLSSIGRKVLIIDMDIRKPSLHKEFNVINDNGLGAILRKEIDPLNAIVTLDSTALDYIPAGELKDIFSAVVFSPKSISFIQDLKNYYDFILIDTPPIGYFVDAIPLMHLSDYNLFIYKAGLSKLRKIKTANKYLEEYKIPNLYVVLNNVDTSNENKGYYTKRRRKLISPSDFLQP